MKILLFGPNGMLGNYFTVYLSKYYETKKIDRNKLDAYYATYDNIMDLLVNYRDDDVFVINCIGIIPQRNDMLDFRKYIIVNTLFPNMLANCCQKLNYKMVHISTDCVYSGNKGDYTEKDVHDETNIYGVTKSLGEPSNCCVIRTSIIGEELQNKKSLLEWIRSQNGKKINGFINHYWNGVTCLQLAKIVHFMIENNIYWNGVRHIYSPSSVIKYELVKMIIEIYNLNITVDKYETATINKTITSIYEPFINIPDIKDQIIELHEFELK